MSPRPTSKKAGLNPAVFYFFASPVGVHMHSVGTVFYRAEGALVAESLCQLFNQEYSDTDGGTTFEHVDAADISVTNQVLLDETLEWVELYRDEDPGVYDPQPPQHMLIRGQYFARALAWEQSLRSKTDPGTTAVETDPTGEKKGRHGRRGRRRYYTRDEMKTVEGTIRETGGSLVDAASHLHMSLHKLRRIHDAARKREKRLG